MALRPTRPSTQQITLGGVSRTLRLAGVGIKRTPITPAMAADPAQIARLLQGLYDELEAATAAARAESRGGGVLQVGVSLAANTPLQVQHGLGKTPTRVWVSAPNVTANGVYPVVSVVPNADPNTTAQYITLEASAACTVDVKVEG